MDTTDFDRLQQTIKNFPGDAEKAINEVFHNEGSILIQDAIRRLMPVSGKSWAGKKPAAKKAKSLTDEKGNLYVTVKTARNYGYLYFPDDGTNTRRHVGNQQFFLRGAESQQAEIVDRCVGRMIGDFEQAI